MRNTIIHTTKNMTMTSFFRVDNERGMALVMSMVMLLILGVLGAMSLGTTSTELKIAGNFRNDQISYYNSNQPEAWGPNNTLLASPIVFDKGPNSTVPPAGGPIEFLPIDARTSIKLQYICVSPVPPDIPAGPDQRAYHYILTTIGTGNNNAQFTTESQIMMLGPVPPDGQTDC